MFYTNYLTLLKRFLFILSFFVFFRAVFYFYNFDYFRTFHFSEALFAYVYGIRFDIAAVLIINSIFILGSLVPITNSRYQLFLKIIFVFLNSIFLGVLLIDLELFIFLGKKMTFDIFGIKNDIITQSLQLVTNYWYLCIVALLNTVLLWKYYPQCKITLLPKHKIKWYTATVFGVIIIALTIIGIRGSIQTRPMSTKSAFIHDSHELGNLSLNAAYSILRFAGKNQAVIKKSYFQTDDEAKHVILKSRTFNLSNEVNYGKQNVIVIILESFSQEYVDNGYTPFLSSLSKKSLYFNDNFANGRRSIEVLPSIMAGFPSILEEPIQGSRYQTNKFYALPKILKENGYQTSFFHGGELGTMEFDTFSYSVGFEKYFSMNDYPHKEHFDKVWGIYDHNYLSFFADNLDNQKEPFFSSVFTLSSHHPYSIPLEFIDKFPVGNLEIIESVGYADYSLREFFKKIETKDWFNNTLFVITGDHTQKLETKKYNNTVGRYKVPLIFYHPSIDLTIFNSDRITQHADILASVLDFLGLNHDKKLLYGSSVFSNKESQAIIFLNGRYFYYKKPYILTYDKIDAKLFHYSNNLSEIENNVDENIKTEMLKELKAYIQYTHNGLINNRIYD
ncbi:MAG: sulfatase-like hydrolase/transferase [Sulfurospirillum sp.]|nr:sulfatase-like hydrolase/transferase [Sulfurospirillum sp.]MBL0702374.1 sulfatase-like hydrolase/transferase [Sulfurospirillum sp.]